jgi:hypothetical protein
MVLSGLAKSAADEDSQNKYLDQAFEVLDDIQSINLHHGVGADDAANKMVQMVRGFTEAMMANMALKRERMTIEMALEQEEQEARKFKEMAAVVLGREEQAARKAQEDQELSKLRTDVSRLFTGQKETLSEEPATRPPEILEDTPTPPGNIRTR